MSWLECFRGKDVCFWRMKDGSSEAQRAREMFYNWGFVYLMVYLLQEKYIIALKMKKKIVLYPWKRGMCWPQFCADQILISSAIVRLKRNSPGWSCLGLGKISSVYSPCLMSEQLISESWKAKLPCILNVYIEKVVKSFLRHFGYALYLPE